jgi:hypothetical protein
MNLAKAILPPRVLRGSYARRPFRKRHAITACDVRILRPAIPVGNIAIIAAE